MKSQGVCVGIIRRPFGVKGEVRIRTYTTSPDSFLRFECFFLQDGRNIKLKDARISGDSEVISFIEGFEDRTSVEELSLNDLFVKRECLDDLAADEYYFEDLVGLTVINQKSEKRGAVKAVLDYGAGTFLDVELIGTHKIATLPFNKNSILNVNLDNGVLQVDDSFLLV